MGHSQNLMDLYAAQLRIDVAYRREWCRESCCESACRTQSKRHPTRRNEARHHEPAPQPADRYRILRNKASIPPLRRRNLVVSARPLYFAVAQEGTRLSSATK